MSIETQWFLVSSHGAVLFYIAVHPDTTIKEIADGMHLTRRTVWGLIGELRRADYLNVRKEGRRHHYTVKLDGYIRHEALPQIPVRLILGDLVRRVSTGQPLD
jgi:DNA-binding IclR family transcriptional regulator